MSQVHDIVLAALTHIRVVDANAAVPDEDAADAIATLNVMMRAQEADGIPLGWQDVSALTDELPTPAGADEALGYNLAVRLASKYGQTPDAIVVQMAAAGTATLRALAMDAQYMRTQYPDLPFGDAQGARIGWREGMYR